MSKSLAVLTLVAIAAVANSQDSDVAAKAAKCATDYMTTQKCGEGCEMVTAQGRQSCTINMQDGIRQAVAAAAAEDGGAGGALAEQMLNNMASNPALAALMKKCVALTDCNADADCQSAEGGGGSCSPTEKAALKVALSKEEQEKLALAMAQNMAGKDTSMEGKAAQTMLQGDGGVLAAKCAMTQASGANSDACLAEKDCKIDGNNCVPDAAAMGKAIGDKCKGYGTMAEISLAASDGELGEAEMKKNAGDKDFMSAILAMGAQDEKCENNAACPAASHCIKAGTDCETDFIPYMKAAKCGASIIAKVSKAFNRAKAETVKKAKDKVVAAKAAVAAAKAKKDKADEAVAACGDDCTPEVKEAASTAAKDYEAAQRTETEAATKASNADASASNAAAAAEKADAENGAAPVAVGAAAVAGVVFAQLF